MSEVKSLDYKLRVALAKWKWMNDQWSKVLAMVWVKRMIGGQIPELYRIYTVKWHQRQNSRCNILYLWNLIVF
eukprot:6061497-Amphidinium_carterae.1